MESAVNISGIGDGEVAHDLQERREVAVPAIVRNLVGEVEKTCSNDGSIGEEAVIQERRFGHVGLVQTEANECDETDNDHGDDVPSLPAVGRRRSKSEGQQEDCQASSKEENARHCVESSQHGDKIKGRSDFFTYSRIAQDHPRIVAGENRGFSWEQ